MDGPFCGSNQSNEVQQYVNCQDDYNSNLPISYGCNEKKCKDYSWLHRKSWRIHKTFVLFRPESSKNESISIWMALEEAAKLGILREFRPENKVNNSWYDRNSWRISMRFVLLTGKVEKFLNSYLNSGLRST